MAEVDIPQEDWFCSDQCRDAALHKSGFDEDHKLAYCTAMAWKGLNLLVRRDAVREGDGEAMIRKYI